MPAVAAIVSGAVANIGSYGLLRFAVGMFPDQLRLAAFVLIVLGAASLTAGCWQWPAETRLRCSPTQRSGRPDTCSSRWAWAAQ
jgi:NADH:ubiquinone oxidoreductase subunit 4 (subunit M)